MKPPTTQNPAYHIRLLFAIGRVARATHPYLTLEGAPSKLCLGGDFDVHPVTDLILVAEIPCLHAVGTETLPPDPPAGCYRRRPNFGTPESRSTFEAAPDRVRQQYELLRVRLRSDARTCASAGKRTRARLAGAGYAVAEAGSCAEAGSTSCGFVLAGPQFG